MRPGDNKWSMTIFARDPDTGEAKWAYQLTPHDRWDYDGVNESIVVDLPIDGQLAEGAASLRPERLRLHDGPHHRPGASGAALSVSQLGEGHRPQHRPARGSPGEADAGRREYHATSVPRPPARRTSSRPRSRRGRGLFYTPTTNLCMDYKGVRDELHRGHAVRRRRGDDVSRAGRQSRRVHRVGRGGGEEGLGDQGAFPVWNGALVTAGDVVFYGTMDGWVKAVDAQNGNVLWKFKSGSGHVGNFMTYTGPDGKQYVAVYAGVGGWAGAVVFGLSPDDPTGALGFANAMKDLPTTPPPAGCCMCSRFRSRRRSRALAVDRAAAARRPAPRPRRAGPPGLRRSRTTCRFPTAARGIREPDRRARGARAACRSRTPGGRSGAASPQHAGGRALRPGHGHAGERRPGRSTTAPYYRSTYVFSRAARQPADPHRSTTRGFGGSTSASTSSATTTTTRRRRRRWRAAASSQPRRLQHLRRLLAPNPPARADRRVAGGDVDVAIVWGPFAGYFGPGPGPARFGAGARRRSTGPGCRSCSPSRPAFAGATPRFGGGGPALSAARPEVRALLARYGVPLAGERRGGARGGTEGRVSPPCAAARSSRPRASLLSSGS